ncbi:MAG: adenosylcobalamin-dependent ribonucleoside-diphosphate reductase [Bacteroidales bacterium]
MDKDLFSNIKSIDFSEEETEKSSRNDNAFYDKIKEAREKSLEEKKYDKMKKEQDLAEAVVSSKAPKETQSSNKRHTYTYEEALEKSTEYFGGDSLAASVWLNKYALKDSDGAIYELTPDDMHRRIAGEIARIEQKYNSPLAEEEIYEALRQFKRIIPQGSPMAGIGNDFQVASLSNCFVIGDSAGADSYGSIMKVDQEQVQLMKRRGGVGHDLSGIRPSGSPVKNSALTSTGIVPFMERYSNSTREVAQDGRRGALMLSISIKHPDAESFIDAKMDTSKITGANVSVKLTDDFMRAVINKEKFVQKFPVDAETPLYKKEVDAVRLWKKVVHNAWKSAEPGILFWDTVIRESLPDRYQDYGFKTVSTNPCGEIPLCPYDSCRLLAINLYGYVENPFQGNASFNWPMFKKDVHLAQRMMDDIIDLELEKIDRIIDKINRDPENEEIKRVERDLWLNIKSKAMEGRRTGIGITAEGDMLAALGYQYGTAEATDFSVKLHRNLAIEAYRSSVNLAKERRPFPIFEFDREIDNPLIKRIKEYAPEVIEDMKTYGRRNIALLTIAPTGSVSMMSQTTSGIEPAFLVTYKRRRKINPSDKNSKVDFVDEVGDSWQEYTVFHHKFEDWLKAKGYNIDEVREFSNKKLDELVQKSPYNDATANDVNWVEKVKMQGAVQQWVDHSISVTVNVPEKTTEELIGQIYETAWKSGCKGMTVYRDGSRSGVLVSDNKKKNDNEFVETKAPKRPKKLEADVVRFQNDYEKWVAVVGLYKGRPYEIFTGKAEGFWVPNWVNKGYVIKNRLSDGSKRYDFQFEDKDGYKVTIEGLSRSFEKEYWNYAKLISGMLRHGMPLHSAVNLVGNLNFQKDTINTWKVGVERALKKFIPDGTKVEGKQCPECGDSEGLVYKEGCLTCKSCGYSKCG